jgi:hypothetical protein
MYQAPKLERFGTLRKLTAGFSKLGSLAGGRESAEVLDRRARMTAVVPVYAVEARRDLTTLDRVAATFIAWQRSSQDLRAMAAAS